MPYGTEMDSTMQVAQLSNLLRENFLNSSKSSFKMLSRDMFSRLRTSRQKLRELSSLLH